MAESEIKPNSDTQNRRRVRYGLNVAIAAVVAVAVVVLLNWLVFRQIERMPPAMKGMVRFDLTSTRQHSLSEQTIQVLRNLDGEYHAVTLLRSGGLDDTTPLDQSRDLVEEYARRSSQFTVEHIDPARDIARLDGFYARLRERYAADVEPMKQAVDRGTLALNRLTELATQQVAPIRDLLNDPALPEGELRQFVTTLGQRFSRLNAEFEVINRQVDTYINNAQLPHYSQARDALRQLLTEIDRLGYAAAIDQLERYNRLIATPPAARERFLAMIDLFKASRQEIADALAAIESAPSVEQYDRISEQLASQINAVVLMNAEKVHIVSLAEMFRDPQFDKVTQETGARPERAFIGEERLTGALISMSLPHRPLIVFVYTTAHPPLSNRGDYQHVGSRLAKLDFQIDQWTPLPRSMPTAGQMLPPAPPPKGEPGQKVVWVVLPFDRPSGLAPTTSPSDQIATHLQERLAHGDSALLMLDMQPAARFGGPDALGQLMETWSLRPLLDRVVLREVQVDARTLRPDTKHVFTEWPSELTVSSSLAGMPGVIVLGTPIELLDTTGKPVKNYPLLTVTGQGLWAERNVHSFPNVKLDPANAAPSFVIGAAAETDDARLAVVADPIWASDYVTTNADPNLRQELRGSAEYFGAAYPGNAELFVNTVCWLANLERLIAASPRTQDIRRIGPIDPARLAQLRWAMLLGMPAITLATGVGVWLVRRRS